MGSNAYGPVKWHCYHDCCMQGCPGHEATLWSKNGGYYLRYQDGTTAELDSDVRLIDAVSWALWRHRGLVEESK